MQQLTAAGVVFDDVVSDRDGDVLYLSVTGCEPAYWEESPEGHGMGFDVDGRLCELTLVSVSRHRDARGAVKVTLPGKVGSRLPVRRPRRESVGIPRELVHA